MHESATSPEPLLSSAHPVTVPPPDRGATLQRRVPRRGDSAFASRPLYCVILSFLSLTVPVGSRMGRDDDLARDNRAATRAHHGYGEEGV